MGNGNNTIFLGNQILDRQVMGRIGNLCFAIIPKLLDEFFKLFNANLSFTEFQTATDTGVFDSSITMYDESGDAHILTLTFIHSGVPNAWIWEASAGADEVIVSGSKGRLEFGRGQQCVAHRRTVRFRKPRARAMRQPLDEIGRGMLRFAMRDQRVAVDHAGEGFEKGRIGDQRQARGIRRRRLADRDMA